MAFDEWLRGLFGPRHPEPRKGGELERASRREVERGEGGQRIGERGEEPWKESRGVTSVVDAVRDLEFPASRDEMSDRVGDREVWISGHTQIELRRVLGKLKDDVRFGSLGEFQTAVQRHWEGIRNLEVPPEQRPPAPRQDRED
jgi:hypothetical protein